MPYRGGSIGNYEYSTARNSAAKKGPKLSETQNEGFTRSL